MTLHSPIWATGRPILRQPRGPIFLGRSTAGAFLVIEAYVKAYQTAELDEQMARMERLSDGELMKIAMGGQAEETVSPVSRPA